MRKTRRRRRKMRVMRRRNEGPHRAAQLPRAHHPVAAAQHNTITHQIPATRHVAPCATTPPLPHRLIRWGTGRLRPRAIGCGNAGSRVSCDTCHARCPKSNLLVGSVWRLCSALNLDQIVQALPKPKATKASSRSAPSGLTESSKLCLNALLSSRSAPSWPDRICCKRKSAQANAKSREHHSAHIQSPKPSSCSHLHRLDSPLRKQANPPHGHEVFEEGEENRAQDEGAASHAAMDDTEEVAVRVCGAVWGAMGLDGNHGALGVWPQGLLAE